MENKEIYVGKAEIENSLSAMNTINDEAENISVASPNIVSVSKGYVAEEIKSCLDLTSDIKKALREMIQGTVQFLTTAGEGFTESDKQSAGKIDSITKG